MTEVPYYSQFESAEMVEAFIEKRQDLWADPLWANSGACDAAEYARWAGEICGIACLRMYLGALAGEAPPSVPLAKDCATFGGYRICEDGSIQGLFYKGFVEFVRARFGIVTNVATELHANDLARLVDGGCMFIASVHPSIRKPNTPPPRKGGHLVLVHGMDRTNDALTFHNPSGYTKEAQRSVKMKLEQFEQFYAARGIELPSIPLG